MLRLHAIPNEHLKQEERGEARQCHGERRPRHRQCKERRQRSRVSFDESTSSPIHQKTKTSTVVNDKKASKDLEQSLRDKLQLCRQETQRHLVKPVCHRDEANILATSSTRSTGESTFKARKASLRDKLKKRRVVFEETKGLLNENLLLQVVLEELLKNSMSLAESILKNQKETLASSLVRMLYHCVRFTKKDRE